MELDQNIIHEVCESIGSQMNEESKRLNAGIEHVEDDCPACSINQALIKEPLVTWIAAQGVNTVYELKVIEPSMFLHMMVIGFEIGKAYADAKYINETFERG